MGASFASFSDVPVMEHFIFGDEHIHRDRQSGQLCRCNSKPDALDPEHHGQQDDCRQLEEHGAEERDQLTPSPRAVKNEEP